MASKLACFGRADIMGVGVEDRGTATNLFVLTQGLLGAEEASVPRPASPTTSFDAASLAVQRRYDARARLLSTGCDEGPTQQRGGAKWPGRTALPPTTFIPR